MHIILRFEIEKALVEGDMTVNDIPSVWNAKMKEYLNVCPPSDAQGCLQDVHWSAGLFGYFPTYTLGAMTAVQIYETAKEQLPSLEEDIKKGNFKPLKEWLNAHVHALGSLYPTADDLLVAVTGKPLDPQIFLTYIKKKYSAIYNI
jgi:carboxypeptidase Taq